MSLSIPTSQESSKSWKSPATLLVLFAILLAGAWLRFMNLGYSDFQGDEIKALVSLSQGESLVDFLLRQRKGPLQWLITYAYGLIDPHYSNYLLLRLPFAIAGFASLFVFYLLTRLYFGWVVASVAAFLMATNGILVGLGRIVQYQSVCMMFLLLSLLFLSLAVQRKPWRLSGLYLGVLCGGLALLAHFDAASAIAPTILLLYWWYKQHAPSLGKTAKYHLLCAVALFALLVASFYLPYLLSVSGYQTLYWKGRLTGSTTSSLELFIFYCSRGTLIFYAILFASSITAIKKNAAFLLLLTWLLPSALFLELFMASPNTHIYVYLIPLFIALGLGYESLRRTSQSRAPKARAISANGLLALGMAWSFALSHYLLIDHQPEFPWSDKQVLGISMKGRELSGSMGFPYRRNWHSVSRSLQGEEDPAKARFITNEKKAIAHFYLLDTMGRYSPEKNPVPGKLYLIAIEGAQSWENNILDRPLEYWRSRYEPVADLSQEGTGGRPQIFELSHDDVKRELAQTR